MTITFTELDKIKTLQTTGTVVLTASGNSVFVEWDLGAVDNLGQLVPVFSQSSKVQLALGTTHFEVTPDPPTEKFKDVENL